MGVYPPEPALDDLARAIEPLGIAGAARGGVNARLAARGLWHLTLAFLGEVPDTKTAAVARALDRAAEQAATSHVRLAGGGRFGKRRFTTVYVAVAGDVVGLERVADAVRHELAAIKIAYDRKRFVPHLTLARPGERLPQAQLLDDLAALEAYRGPLWTNTEIALVASHLGPHPRHEVMHTATLVR